MALTDAQKAKLIKLEQLAKFKELADAKYQDAISDLSTIRSGAAAGATAYQKPQTGIPATDLATAVQDAITAAGTALQPADIETLTGKVTALEALISEDPEATTHAIDKFNEIVDFLEGITDTQTLDGILSGINDAIAAKYTKPTGGIPKSDLTQGVQNSLDAADSAYQKPSTGIPATDLAQAVQDSLALANSAVQAADISGKADKSEMSVVAGTGTDADKTTITLKTGTSATVLTAHQDISGKVDKVTGKDLSTNDYSDADKAKVDALAYATDSDVEAIF